MNPILPRIESRTPSLALTGFSGFRDPEPWGRWTLGKTATIDLEAGPGGWTALDLRSVLPFREQTFRVLLNGQEVTRLQSAQPNANYQISLALKLRPGVNEVQLLTDKSNRDARLTPFAPRDPSDLGVALQQLSFGKPEVFSRFPADTIYGASWNPLLSTYAAAPTNEVTIFSRASGPQELGYSLLRTREGQRFTLQLDGAELQTLSSPVSGNLVKGRLQLTLNGQEHRLTLRALPDQASAQPLGGGMAALRDVDGQIPFYVQNLSLVPVASGIQQLSSLAAGALVLMMVLALYAFLFKVRPRRVRTAPSIANPEST